MRLECLECEREFGRGEGIGFQDAADRIAVWLWVFLTMVRFPLRERMEMGLLEAMSGMLWEVKVRFSGVLFFSPRGDTNGAG